MEVDFLRFEKLNIQMDNDQAKYKNRILTHSPQQPVQEANLLSSSQTYLKADFYL